MNILMIVTNPFTNDPRVENEALSLVKSGNNVTVLAWDITGKNQLSEEKNGINVQRSFNTNFMKYLRYDIFRLHFWWIKGFRDAQRLFKKNKFDVIHCHDLDTLPIGVKLKKKFNIPLIYDAHEIWGYMVSRDLPKIWAKYYLFLEKRLLKKVDYIITVNQPLNDYFSSISEKPVEIVMNCKPLQGKYYQEPNNEIFTLLYLGSLSKSRFLLELLEVVKELPDVYCFIGGKGKNEYENQLKKKCLTVKNSKFIGLAPMEDVIPMTKKSNVVICMTSPNDPNNSIATANKQFEAMVCGRPIICTKNTYPGIFTENLKCGLTAEYNINDLKNKIIELKENPQLCTDLGKNALNATINEYNWDKQEEKLLEIYNKLYTF